MARIILTRDDTGRLDGLTDADKRAYGRFRVKVGNLGHGDTLAFEFKLPRSPRFHRLHFAFLGALFDCQEVFDDPERMRKWIEVGAGHVDFVPGPAGELMALPRSVAYEALEDSDFREHHLKVIGFLRTPGAYRFIWPHLSDDGREQMINAILEEFDA